MGRKMMVLFPLSLHVYAETGNRKFEMAALLLTKVS